MDDLMEGAMAQCDQTPAPETARTPAVPASSGRSHDNSSPLIRVAQWRQRVAASGRNDGLTTAHVALMFVVAQYQGRNDASRAGQKTIVRAAGGGRSSGQDQLRELVASGYLLAEETKGGPVLYSIAADLDAAAQITSRVATVSRDKRSAGEPARPPGNPSDVDTLPGHRATPARLPGNPCPATGQPPARLPGTKRPVQETMEETTYQTNPPSGGTRAGEVGGVVSVGEVSVVRDEQSPQSTATTETVERTEQAKTAKTGETFTLTHPDPFAPPPEPPKAKDPKKAAAAKVRAQKTAKDKARARVEAWHPHDGHGELAGKLGVDLADVLAQYRAELRAKPLFAPDDLDSGFEALIHKRAPRVQAPRPAAPAHAVQVDTWPGKPADGRFMRAKRDGDCLVCGKRIQVGEEQWWYPGDGVRHPACLGPRAQRPGLARSGSDFRKQPSGLPGYEQSSYDDFAEMMGE